MGDERLRLALERARADGQAEAWIEAAITLWSQGESVPGVGRDQMALWGCVAHHADQFRAGLRSRAGRLWAGQVLERLAAPLIEEIATDTQDVSAAFSISEALRARTLLDELMLSYTRLPADTEPRAAAIEAELMAVADPPEDLVKREVQILTELPLSDQPHAGYARERAEQVERIYSEGACGFRLGDFAPVWDLDAVGAALRSGEILVSYFIPYHWSHPALELFAVVVTDGGSALISCPLDLLPASGLIGRVTIGHRSRYDLSPLGEAIASTRRAIQEVEEPAERAHLRRLDEVLLSPIRATGALEVGGALIVAPHRALHAVPWSALIDDRGDRLVQRSAVGVTPSASVLAALRDQEFRRPSSYLGVADPELALAGYEPLDEARHEVAEVRAQFQSLGVEGDMLVGPDATEAAFRRGVPGRSIVHLATHAQFPGHDALTAHSLLLAPAEDQDGVVQADEFRFMDFDGTWLSVLSVCDGGLVRFGPTSEPYGLLRALLVAGARNVIAPLWQIEDTAARRMITRLAGDLLKAGPAQALGNASGKSMTSWPTVDWAGFVVAGACD